MEAGAPRVNSKAWTGQLQYLQCIQNCLSYRYSGKVSGESHWERLVCILDGSGVAQRAASMFDKKQFAYLSNRSSTQAVLSLIEPVKASMLEGKVTGILFFDFADAFGIVNRTKLLLKLRQDFGITGRFLLYVSDFLAGWYARLRVNDLIGEWIRSEYGTSAGTILGALLLIAYAHDIPGCIQPKFANIASCVTGDNVYTVQSGLQECIEQLQAWSLQWDMRLNVDKTKAMFFGHQPGDRLSLSLDGVSIEQVTEFKYLGVILDEQLKFDAHVDYAATKARKAFAKVSMLFQG